MVQVTQPFVHRCLPIRDRNGHKGNFGKVHILAGSVGFTGAPALASEAAVRTGSGLVSLSVPQEISAGAGGEMPRGYAFPRSPLSRTPGEDEPE